MAGEDIAGGGRADSSQAAVGGDFAAADAGHRDVRRSAVADPAGTGMEKAAPVVAGSCSPLRQERSARRGRSSPSWAQLSASI